MECFCDTVKPLQRSSLEKCLFLSSRYLKFCWKKSGSRPDSIFCFIRRAAYQFRNYQL